MRGFSSSGALPPGKCARDEWTDEGGTARNTANETLVLLPPQTEPPLWQRLCSRLPPARDCCTLALVCQIRNGKQLTGCVHDLQGCAVQERRDPQAQLEQQRCTTCVFRQQWLL